MKKTTKNKIETLLIAIALVVSVKGQSESKTDTGKKVKKDTTKTEKPITPKKEYKLDPGAIYKVELNLSSGQVQILNLVLSDKVKGNPQLDGNSIDEIWDEAKFIRHLITDQVSYQQVQAYRKWQADTAAKPNPDTIIRIIPKKHHRK